MPHSLPLVSSSSWKVDVKYKCENTYRAPYMLANVHPHRVRSTIANCMRNHVVEITTSLERDHHHCSNNHQYLDHFGRPFENLRFYNQPVLSRSTCGSFTYSTCMCLHARTGTHGQYRNSQFCLLSRAYSKLSTALTENPQTVWKCMHRKPLRWMYMQFWVRSDVIGL